jgi:hypothetical protein
LANKDAPHGFRPVRQLHGGRVPMHQYKCSTTTAIYEGDIVQLKSTGNVKTITTVTGVDTMVGVAAEYAAIATTDILVYDDPYTVFEAQCDGATDPGTTTSLGHIGNTCDLILTTGNTTTLLSKHEIDYSQITTATASGAMQIVGFYEGVDNDVTLAHARYEVIFQRHLYTDKLHVV